MRKRKYQLNGHLNIRIFAVHFIVSAVILSIEVHSQGLLDAFLYTIDTVHKKSIEKSLAQLWIEGDRSSVENEGRLTPEVHVQRMKLIISE